MDPLLLVWLVVVVRYSGARNSPDFDFQKNGSSPGAPIFRLRVFLQAFWGLSFPICKRELGFPPLELW